MEKSSFFNAELVGEEYDRTYLAEDYAQYFASFIGNGVFPNPSNNLQIIADGTSMNITLKRGEAWINGYFYNNTDDLILAIAPADGVLNRIDRVVLRLDFLNREIKAYVKKGAFASSPVAIELKRDADMYEIALADIKVSKGVIKITQADITDLRLSKELCGIVHGTVDQADTTAIFNQFQSWYSQKQDEYSTNIEQWTTEKQNDFSSWTEDKKDSFDIWYATNTQAFMNQFNNWFNTNTNTWTTEFTEWFNSIKGQLDGDIATNLAGQIIDINNKFTVLSGQVENMNNQLDNVDRRTQIIDKITNYEYTWRIENGVVFLERVVK